MELEKLNEWNPWWENVDRVTELTGNPRPRYDSLLNSVKIKEITILVGVRRAGKSTLMYQMIATLLKSGINPEQVLMVNFEDKKLANDSLDDLYRCYREGLNPDKKAYIFFDEVHKKDGWESWIRKKYDQKTNDKFVISGSCSYLLKKEYSALLTGRNLTFEVFPLDFEEFLSFKGVLFDKDKIIRGTVTEKTKILILHSLNEYLNSSGFPEAAIKEKDYKELLLKQYFDDILYKDIIDRYNLNSQKTRDFALFLMTNFTSKISLRSIRTSLGISYDSIKDYLSYFKEAFLFFAIDHFSYSFKEQKTLPSKIYCIDNGLRNSVAFRFSRDEGKLAENLVLVELKRRDKDPYYWTNEKQGEVDFIIKNKDNSVEAINVSYADEIDNRETEGLLSFKEKFAKAKKLIIITKNIEKEEKTKNKKIRFIPLWKWLLGKV